MTFSSAGMTRYVSRLVRFHSFLDSGVESPVPDLSENEPLPLWHTWAYTEKPEMAEILSGYGYNLRKRKANRAAKKAGKRKSGGAPKEGDVLPVLTGEKEKVVAMETDGGSSEFEVLPVDPGTLRAMVSQISTLKKDLKAAKGESESKEKELGKIRKALEGYKSDIRLYKEDVRGLERRCRTLERAQIRQSERHWEDQLDWTDVKRELQMEIGDLKDSLEDETLAREAIEAKYTVWEQWAAQQGWNIDRARRARDAGFERIVRELQEEEN